MGGVDAREAGALQSEGGDGLILCANCNKGIAVAYNELCFVCYQKVGRKFTRRVPRNDSLSGSRRADMTSSKVRRFSTQN